MRADPPAELIELLERLHLAHATDLVAVQGRVRQMAGELPLFPSIWVDALAQARRITPLQAAEINARRGRRLAVGPFVLTSPILSLGYAECYRAKEVESNREINLIVGLGRASATQSQAGPTARLEQLPEVLASVNDRRLVQPILAGTDDDRPWIACLPIKGTSLSDVLRRTGRLHGAAVLDIARQMAAGLAALDTAGMIHGDLSPRTVWIDERGQVRLAWTGARAAFRPDEDFAQPNLPPHAYDYLAPERIRESVMPTVGSDMFACGCLWWHLVAGRPPFSGGTSRGKLRAVATARLADLKRFAADAPAPLVSAIACCTHRDPDQRPKSFHALLELLGDATSHGRRAVSSVYCKADRRTHGLRRAVKASIGSRDAAAWTTTMAVCATVIIAVAWPLMRTRTPAVKAKTAPPAVLTSLERHQAPLTAQTVTTYGETSGVVPAAYRGPDPNVLLDRTASKTDDLQSRRVQASPDPLMLSADQPTAWNRVVHLLHPGQTVQGQPGERPIIVVPPAGLIIAVEDVRFENVDFVWQPASDAPLDPERAALIDLRASRASFSGCTFQAANRARNPQPAAVCWSDPRRTGRLPPAGRLQLSDCVVSGVSAGIVARLNSPLEVKLSNVLHLGPGPLLNFDHSPKIDEPVDVALANCTLRGATALAAFRIDQTSIHEIGALTITTNDCVLAPSADGALVRFAGTTLAKELPRSIQWSGQGSLATPDARVAIWAGANGGAAGDDLEIAVDGLVSGRFEFVGPPDAGSSASRVTHWLSAGSSAEPPGIRDGLPNLRSLDLNDQ